MYRGLCHGLLHNLQEDECTDDRKYRTDDIR